MKKFLAGVFVIATLRGFFVSVLAMALAMAPVDAATQHHVRASAKPGLYLLPGLEPFRAQVTQNSITVGSTPVYGTCSTGQNLYNNNGVVGCQANGGGGGTPGGTSGQIQYNNSGAFGGFTLGGDCTFSVPNITCTAINGKNVTLGAALTTTGAGATTLAFGAAGNTYTFPNSSDTVVTLAATQTLTGKSIAGSEINSGTVPLAQSQPGMYSTGYNTGNNIDYPNPLATGTVQTGAVGVANSYYCIPFGITAPSVTVNAMGIRVITTSAGNSSAALQGAFYNNLVTTGGLNRPGTLIDYTANFATGAAATVTAAMHNGTDVLTGPWVWACIQKFDAVATYATPVVSTSLLAFALTGAQSMNNALASTPVNCISTTGTAYGTTNWVNFTTTNAFNDQAGAACGPVVGIVVN